MDKLINNINRLFLSCGMLLLIVSPVAQAQNADENLDMLVDSTKSDLLVVVGGGLAGAILGLSTLSFVAEPKDHTRNIIMGASIGIIAGVGYVAFSQANKTQELIYGGEEGMMDEEVMLESTKSFNTYARNDWHFENIGDHTQTIVSPYQLGYNFKF